MCASPCIHLNVKTAIEKEFCNLQATNVIHREVVSRVRVSISHI